MLLGQNKETTATLEKLVDRISMTTKEYSIGSHFELTQKQYKIGWIE